MESWGAGAEGVVWFVMEKHPIMTAAQVDALKALFDDGGNARPVQP